MSPLDQDLVDLMRDTVTLEPSLGPDKFNDLQFDTPVDVACYITRTNVRVLNKEGREVTSTVQVILADPTRVVSPDDRLTLPDGTHPAIMEVLAAPDDEGPYYLEIRA